MAQSTIDDRWQMIHVFEGSETNGGSTKRDTLTDWSWNSSQQPHMDYQEHSRRRHEVYSCSLSVPRLSVAQWSLLVNYCTCGRGVGRCERCGPCQSQRGTHIHNRRAGHVWLAPSNATLRVAPPANRTLTASAPC